MFSFIVNYSRVEDRSRYQERRKSREGDKVCKENEEDVGENWSSVKKSTREDKVTSR